MKHMKFFIFFVLIVITITACGRTTKVDNTRYNSTGESTLKQNQKLGVSNITSPEEDYKKYIDSLSVNDFRTIDLAYRRFLEYITDDKKVNSCLFRDFYEHYYLVFANITYSISDGKTFDENELLQNGFTTMEYEEGKFIFMKPDYLENNFLQFVSEGTAEFIKLDYEDKKLRNAGFLISDGLLAIRRDELSDILIEWEKYIRDFPQNEWECRYSKENIDDYIKVYTDIELNTFSDMNGETMPEDDISHSYKRFLEKYTDSSYYKLIKEYYDELVRSGVKKTEITAKILKKYGIEVPGSDPSNITGKTSEQNNVLSEAVPDIPSMETMSNSTQESSAVNPILIIINNLLIGAYKGNEWVTYESVFNDISDNTEFSVYSNYKYRGSGIVKSMNSRESINIPGFEDFSDNYVALSNNYKALKRIPEFDDEKKHNEILALILQKQGLDDFTLNVMEAIDVDLDGDGNDEFITIGSSFNEKDCIEEAVYKANNNYSVMIFSEEGNGKYNSTVIDESTGYKNEDSTTEALDINKDTMIISEIYYSVIGLLDINNDNILEVAIKEESFGGAEFRIYAYLNGKLEIVLQDFYGYK